MSSSAPIAESIPTTKFQHAEDVLKTLVRQMSKHQILSYKCISYLLETSCDSDLFALFGVDLLALIQISFKWVRGFSVVRLQDRTLSNEV